MCYSSWEREEPQSFPSHSSVSEPPNLGLQPDVTLDGGVGGWTEEAHVYRDWVSDVEVHHTVTSVALMFTVLEGMSLIQSRMRWVRLLMAGRAWASVGVSVAGWGG